MRKILISGIPGTGKTTIGEYLKEKHGFKHVDIEVILTSPESEREKRIQELFTMHAKEFDRDTVFTWGFHPVKNEPHINYLKSLGVKMFWFDGNRVAARKAFLTRGSVSEELLDIQMGHINRADIRKLYNPIFYNTFDKDGKFKSSETIVADLLKEFDSNA
jgi:hypothetical protein